MLKNRFLICILILSIWFSTTGFQQPPQSFTALPLAGSPVVTAAVTVGKIYPANNATNVTATSLTLQWGAVQGYNGAVTYRYCLQTKTKCPGGKWVRAGANTSATVTNLLPNTTYHWWVRAYDSRNVLIASADSGLAWVFTTMSLPGTFNKIAPVNLSTNVNTSNLQLSWGASANASSYEYCLDNTNNNICDTSWVPVPSGTSASVNLLYSNAVYYWQVRAVNGGGRVSANNGGWWQFTTQILPGVFNKLSPANNATGQLVNGLIISWEISSTATGYEYCVSTTSGSCTTWINAGNQTYATINNLQYSTDYYWQARAVNAGGNIPADSGIWWKFTTQTPPPSAFTKQSPFNGALTQPVNLNLSWAASSGADSYEYCLTITPGSVCDGPWTSINSSPVVLSSLDLDYATLYYWQVRAVNATGTTESNAGTWWSFTTQIAPPAAFYKTSPSNGADNQPLNLNFAWTASDPGVTYEYCVSSTNNTCDAPNWSTTTSTSVTPGNIQYGHTYYWQVRAKNADNTITEADGGAWYSFSTYPQTPTSLVKIYPTNNLVNQPLNPWLYWAANVQYTSYQYCYSQTPGCSSWVTTTATSVQIGPLANNTTYYWQVRVSDGVGGFIYANEPNGEWNFTTLPAAPSSSNVSFNEVEDVTAHEALSATGTGTLSFALYGAAPANGDLLLSADGTFIFIPQQDFNGPVTFQYTVSDGINVPSGPYAVTLNFAPVNDKPVVQPIADIIVHSGETAAFNVSASDVDGDTLSYTITPLPAGATINPSTGAFSWLTTPAVASLTPYTLTVTVSDGTALVNQPVKITVLPASVTVVPRMIYIPVVSR